jgi:hypothetical protein
LGRFDTNPAHYYLSALVWRSWPAHLLRLAGAIPDPTGQVPNRRYTATNLGIGLFAESDFPAGAGPLPTALPVTFL